MTWEHKGPHLYVRSGIEVRGIMYRDAGIEFAEEDEAPDAWGLYREGLEGLSEWVFDYDTPQEAMDAA